MNKKKTMIMEKEQKNKKSRKINRILLSNLKGEVKSGNIVILKGEMP